MVHPVVNSSIFKRIGFDSVSNSKRSFSLDLDLTCAWCACEFHSIARIHYFLFLLFCIEKTTYK